MCVGKAPMAWSQRLVGFVPLLSFVAIEWLRPGIWRHALLVADLVLLLVVIGLMMRDKRRGRERRF
jgi:hypothetical protein